MANGYLYFANIFCRRPALRGALLGCLALFERTQLKSSTCSIAELSAADALSILSSFFKNVYVRSLSAFDRATALTTLRLAVKKFGQAALDDGIDVLEFSISSVDGEKDPRCLIQGFQAMRCVMQLYIAQDDTTLASGRLEESTEELFDVLSCYFPVAFTPPPNDPHGITRGQIASELESALIVYPAFAPFIMDLVSEKLGSTLLHAKMDALHLLQSAAAAFGRGGGVEKSPSMREHSPAIWAALKKEIMAPTTEGLVEPELVKVEDVATAAAACLRACVIAFSKNADGIGGDTEKEITESSSSLPSLVLNDTGVEDMFTCIASPGMDRASLRRSVALVKSMSLALGTLGSAGGQAAVEMVSKIIPKLLNAISIASENSTNGYTSLQSLDLAWAALASLLRAMNTASNDHTHSINSNNKCVPVMDEALLGRLLNAAMDMKRSSLQNIDDEEEEEEKDTAAAVAEPMDESEANVPSAAAITSTNSSKLWLWDLTETSLGRIQWLKLTVLQAVLSCSNLTMLLSENNGREILEFLVKAAIDIKGNGGKEETERGQSSSASAAAAAALCAAARILDPEVVIKYAFTPLIEASTQNVEEEGHSPSGVETRSRSAALGSLKSLCVSNPSALLQPSMVGLEAALHPAMQQATVQKRQQTFVIDILSTVSEVILEVSESGTGTDQAAVHAACFATFAEHLLDEVLLLIRETEQIAHPNDDDGTKDSVAVALKIARIVFLGTRSASVEAQRKICTAAVEAVSLSSENIENSFLAFDAGCAAFIALRREITSVTVEEHPSILPLLVEKAFKYSTCAFPSFGAVALASFFNKIDASLLTSAESTSVLATLTDDLLLQIPDASEALVEVQFSMVAEVTRGLAMRGATAPADNLTRQVASHLKSSTCLLAAASFFKRILYSEDEDDDGVVNASSALTHGAHAVVRPLWKQRTFNVAAAALDKASKDMQVQHEDSSVKVLACAMGSLLGAAPPAVLRADLGRTLPWLTRCLSELSKQEPQQQAIIEPLESNTNTTTKTVLQTLLKSTIDLLSTETGRKQAEGSLPTLIPALMRLGQYRPAMAVREMSLRCLTMLMMLPYAVLHPYKKQVLPVASAAADDGKRSVRGAAALCREAWGGGFTSII